MVRKVQENVYMIRKELMDIKQILKYGNCGESQRRYLTKRRNELEKKLNERVSD